MVNFILRQQTEMSIAKKMTEQYEHNVAITKDTLIFISVKNIS